LLLQVDPPIRSNRDSGEITHFAREDQRDVETYCNAPEGRVLINRGQRQVVLFARRLPLPAAVVAW
jgi:hypothetical protein